MADKKSSGAATGLLEDRDQAMNFLDREGEPQARTFQDVRDPLTRLCLLLSEFVFVHSHPVQDTDDMVNEIAEIRMLQARLLKNSHGVKGGQD